jgi:hypothetical protein
VSDGLDLRAGETIFMPAPALEQWAKAAKPGERRVYALGNLTKDGRVPAGGLLLHDTAKMARRWARAELVILVQRKVAEECYEYIAVKTAGPR